MIAAVGFLVAVAYWPGIDGAATSTRWAVIFGTAWCFLRPTALTAGHLGMAALIGWAALSLAWTPYPWDGTWVAAELAVIGMVFWAGSCEHDLRPTYAAMAAGLGVSSALAIAQSCGYSPEWIAQSAAPAGLFVNKNIMGEIAALLVVALVLSRMWWWLPAVLPALLLSGSRAAALAVVAGLLCGPLKNLGIAAVICGAGILIGGLGLGTLAMRLDYWSAIAGHLVLAGHGAGSFLGLVQDYVQNISIENRPIHAHNDILEMVFELGVGAGALICVLALSADHGVIAGFIVLSLFGFPLHCPATAFLFALVAGHRCRDRLVIWHHADGRRGVVQARN